jgi:hypothetical protein
MQSMGIQSSRALSKLEIGGGVVCTTAESVTRMAIPGALHGYADAQLDTYRDKPRKDFPWRPPVRLALRARSSAPSPVGTLGFGFWNDPFTLSLGQGGAARRIPAAPQTVWFFYGSPPNHFTFTSGLKGHGFKAMAMRTPPIPPLILAPFAAVGILLAEIPVLRRLVLRTALRAVEAVEAELEVALDEWHQYALVWEFDHVRFEIDERTVLEEQIQVPGPLGFVTWIDNQYATVSPEKGFRFGVIPTDRSQWLEISDFNITGASA